MRKIYIIPNFVTTANMFCGFYSVVASIQGDFVSAAWSILAAGVFDLLDGRIARLAHATSQFGVEYDSLSDLISFGMAPAVLLYQWALSPFGRLGWLASFLFLTCSALRLARFNVNVGNAPKTYFQGLPTPIAAGVVASFMVFWKTVLTFYPLPQVPESLVLGLSLGLASLMVSTIRFPSFKELHWRSQTSFSYLLVGILMMILIATRPEITIFLIMFLYIVFSLIWNLVPYFKRDSRVSIESLI